MSSSEDPLEDLVKQMSLKKPSRSLDDRIEQLSVGSSSGHFATSERDWNASRWYSSALVSGVSLAIGVGCGWLLAIALPFSESTSVSQPSTNGTSAEHSAVQPSELAQLPRPNEKVAANQVQPTDDGEVRTTILDEHLVSTPTGDIKRIYRATTLRDLWYFDDEADEMRNIKVTVPQFIVTNPVGI